jgi:peptidoglycan LD-endopeptidase CwlK
MDPASVTLAIGAATKAFSMLKRGFEIGRDIESMHGDIQKWMGASAQIAAIEKTTKNPSVITRLLTGSDNIEAMATQAVLARKQLEQQRYDLKIWVSMTYGIGTWEEILRTEGLLRKQRQAAMEQQQAFFAKVFLGASLFVTVGIGGGLAVLFCNVSEGTATMKNLTGILGAVAPTLATAMGGPLGGMALKMVADKLGLPESTMDAVEAAVTNASPSQLADIKKVEADFKVSMKQLDVDLVKIAASDRDSARRRHASVKDMTPTVLGGWNAPCVLWLCWGSDIHRPRGRSWPHQRRCRLARWQCICCYQLLFWRQQHHGDKNMTFKLSQRSLDKLEGVDEQLVATVKLAIAVTKIDFGVICGLRTMEEQRILVDKGASKTMRSKHLDGKAVDLMAYIGDGRASWELNLYDDIADAMKEAAVETGAVLRWGAAWHINDIRDWDGTMEDAMNSYVDLRRSQGKRPFIDGPHFEIA